MSSIHDGKTRMGRKARILLIFLIVTCASAISAAFHNCYVIDAYHPELPANVPPSIDYAKLDPVIYGQVNIDLSTHQENDLQPFSIKEIYDPDQEQKLYGKYAIDYYGTGTVTGDQFIVYRITDPEEGATSDILWQGYFNIDIFVHFSPPGTYEVLAAVSDRPWKEPTPESPNPGWLDVPDDTQAAVVKWTIVTYCSIPESCGQAG